MSAQRFHVGEYIRDEMEARCWSQEELADRMGGDYAVNLLALEMLVLEDPGIMLGEEMANGLARAFGSNASTWLKIDSRWREWKTSQN